MGLLKKAIEAPDPADEKFAAAVAADRWVEITDFNGRRILVLDGLPESQRTWEWMDWSWQKTELNPQSSVTSLE
jgi:hypothetical protein